MRARGERGSILAQVLITMLFMMVISVSILRMRLQPAMNAARSVARVGDNLAADAALNRLTESWTRLGTCASDEAAGVSCVGSACDCRCVVGAVVVSASPQNGACALNVVPGVSP